MLAVSPLISSTTAKDEAQEQMESFSTTGNEEFPDLLESINFDDLFTGINDGDVLPDLEMDPEILAEFSVSSGGEESDINTSISTVKVDDNSRRNEDDNKTLGSVLGFDSSSSCKDEEIISKRDEYVTVKPVSKESGTGRKSSSSTQQAKSTNNSNNQGKKKVKVDWTPELHRRFVQAVEQLGVDKAVPSRILELMGIDCLTRHNIASHLQKYRSHRKHLLAREAEAATWSHRRQIYGGGGAGKAPWHAPTMGFPPVTPMHHHFRPLHVWGHPPMEQPTMHMWPKHIAQVPPPPLTPHTWLPVPPPPDPSYWHLHSHQQRVPNGPTSGTPCYPQPMATTRFAVPAVAGIPPAAMFKVEASSDVATRQSRPSPLPPFDSLPSKESIDAAIGDVLSKPWLPLPIGLKPPSVDGVIGKLQQQGVAKIPPSCA